MRVPAKSKKENSMDTIHGHKVLELIIKSPNTFTTESLIQKITDDFGQEATFYTCSEESLSPEGLLEFLLQKGKFIINADKTLTTDPSAMCNH